MSTGAATFSRHAFRLWLLGILLLVAGCSQGASSIGSSDQNATSMLRLGDHMRANGDLTSAAAFYRQAADLAVDDPATLLKIGDMLTDIGDSKDAIGAYRLALAADPGDQHVRGILGRALLIAGETDESIQMLQYALDRGGADPDLLLNLGTAYDLSAQPEKAAQAYRQGLEIDPDNLDLKSNLALSLALVGELNPAIELVEEVALHPDATQQHHRNLVLVFAMSGQRAEHVNLHRHLTDGEIEELRRQAKWLQMISPPSARARAIGTAPSP